MLKTENVIFVLDAILVLTFRLKNSIILVWYLFMKMTVKKFHFSKQFCRSDGSGFLYA